MNQDARGYRHGEPFICTFTGRKVWPPQMDPADIHILDIAHALSQKCRYTGHTRTFYSVAEHSVLMAHADVNCPAQWRLLHDATEAYVPDVPCPMKLYMPEFQKIEDSVGEAIVKFFGLPLMSEEECKALKDFDRDMVYWEGRALMPDITHCRWARDEEEPKEKVKIYGWPPLVAEQQFILMHRKLFYPKQERKIE